MKKRSFAYFGKARNWYRISFKELAGRAEVTPEYVSLLEKRRSEPGVSIALRIALALGLSIDDILNLHSGLERLLAEHRPLFRLPYSLISSSSLVELVARLNQPTNLQDEHYASFPGTDDNRSSLMLELAKRIAAIEKTSPDYQSYGRAEFVPREVEGALNLPLAERLELGEAYSALLEQRKLSTYAFAKQTSLSRRFLADLMQSRVEVSVVNLDLACWIVGVTVDELIYTAYPQLSRIKWPFFVQARPEPYQNEEMVRLLTSPAVLQSFEANPVYERARMMLAYKSWWLSEARASELAAQEAGQSYKVLTPAIFQLTSLT